MPTISYQRDNDNLAEDGDECSPWIDCVGRGCACGFGFGNVDWDMDSALLQTCHIPSNSNHSTNDVDMIHDVAMLR
jgi:hypothetical protein